MDKFETAEVLQVEFNYPWIDEWAVHEGAEPLPDNAEGVYAGEGECDFFIDVEVNMEGDLPDKAYKWYMAIDVGEDDEFGNTLEINYDEAEEVAQMRNDDIDDPDYEGANDHIEIRIQSQTHLVHFVEQLVEYNKGNGDGNNKTDRDLALEAIKNDKFELEDADDTLKADREVVLGAVKSYGLALDYADDSLKADREIVLEAVRNYGCALQYADDTLKADREIVLEAVKSWGYALDDADDSLKADREVVLEAVRNNGEALKYASEELQNDPELKKLANESDNEDEEYLDLDID